MATEYDTHLWNCHQFPLKTWIKKIFFNIIYKIYGEVILTLVSKVKFKFYVYRFCGDGFSFFCRFREKF